MLNDTKILNSFQPLLTYNGIRANRLLKLYKKTPKAKLANKTVTQLQANMYVMENSNRLITEYNTELINNGYGLDKASIESENMVDISQMVDTKHHSIIFKNVPVGADEYINNNQFEMSLPCFEHGIYKYGNRRYIAWHINDIDINKKEYKVYIQEYSLKDGKWFIGTYCDVCIAIVNGSIHYKINNYVSCDDLYTLIPTNKLKWTELDKVSWDILKEIAQRHTEKGIEKEIRNFITVYMKTTMLTSYILSTQPKQKGTHTKTKPVTISTAPTPTQQIVRTIGCITIKADKEPIIRKPKSEVCYKTPAWVTRGHIRHYKNGKTVYIKESTHKRKAFKEQGDIKVQTIIKLGGQDDKTTNIHYNDGTNGTDRRNRK